MKKELKKQQLNKASGGCIAEAVLVAYLEAKAAGDEEKARKIRSRIPTSQLEIFDAIVGRLI